MTELPIGIFDSGVGGLTVYRALHDRLPNERFIYLGDTRPRSIRDEIARYGREIRDREFALSRLTRIKMLVVACNTASALALPAIRKAVGLDVVGVIGPGGRKAVALTSDKEKPRIGVIATEATVASNAYVDAIRRASDSAEVMQAACPLFVPLAEENWVNEPETASIAERYLSGIKAFEPDVLVLGCTHYPILKDVIASTVGAGVTLVDSGEATAGEVTELLNAKGLASTTTPRGERRLCDDLDHFYVTDAAERFARVAERFLGVEPSVLEGYQEYGKDALTS